MPSLAAIREQRRSASLTALRAGAANVAARHSGGEVWLFGSLARGDWDACSDVDLLAIAPNQEQAEALADALLDARLGDDVLALSQERWQQLKQGDDPYWLAISRDALRLDAP
ncbi:MAG: nucleotidyltransferase domain-containing protein [Cyanobacteria bacterium M_DeepCast_100m_m1_067]|nr:nucleotidyltransferase domain-containing protein [Cyanobacteria bacterium M_DeepCast_100m_m1_067]